MSTPERRRTVKRTIGVGSVGVGGEGLNIARACRQLPLYFPEADIEPRLVICADSVASRAETAKDRLGFENSSTDWRAVIDDPAVDAVMIATPNRLHLEVARAAAAAGKHIFCEKPAGRGPDDTEQIAAAVRAAGVVYMVGHNFRFVPAVEHARDLVRDGALGDLTHYRGRYFIKTGADPESPLAWRYREADAGYGALGDLMSHVADMAMSLAGPIARVVANRKTIVTDRPLESGAPGERGPVENDDYVGALVEFGNGALGSLEVCRTIQGPTNEHAFEINGTAGAVKWNLERINVLQVYLNASPEPGYTQVFSAPGHGQHGAYNQSPGLGPGLRDLKTIELHRFFRAVLGEADPVPGIEASLAVAAVQRAMAKSWESDSWEAVARP
jgi:predicted dehydrogenase